MTNLQPRLALPTTETFQEWSDLGKKLATSNRAINWLIGDWLIAGSDLYGDKARDEANAIFRTDATRFGPIVDTCRSFPEQERHLALTFDHHLAVLKVRAQDPEAANVMLDNAERLKLPLPLLRAQVRERAVSTGQMFEQHDDDPEDTAMRGIVQAWNRAPRSAREAFLELTEAADMGVIDL